MIEMLRENIYLQLILFAVICPAIMVWCVNELKGKK